MPILKKKNLLTQIITISLLLLWSANATAMPASKKYSYEEKERFHTIAGKIAKKFLAKKPIKDYGKDLDIVEAMEVQKYLGRRLTEVYGKKIGYKVTLTSKKAQEEVNYDKPVLGILYYKMLNWDAGYVTLNFAIRPTYEANLLIRVKDDGFNYAETPRDILDHIDFIYPIIEFVDIGYKESVKITGPKVAAINAGARKTVVGKGIKVTASDELYERLKNFKVHAYNRKSELLEKASGSNILGHPMVSALWARDMLKNQNLKLLPGDILSLGAITTPLTPRDGEAVAFVYDGLLENGRYITLDLGFKDPK